MKSFTPKRRLKISELSFAVMEPVMGPVMGRAMGRAMGRVGVSITRNILKKIQDDTKQNVPHTNYITRTTSRDFFSPKGVRDGVPVNAFDDKKAWEIARQAAIISVVTVALSAVPLLSIKGAVACGIGSMLLGAIGEKLHIDSKEYIDSQNKKAAAEKAQKITKALANTDETKDNLKNILDIINDPKTSPNSLVVLQYNILAKFPDEPRISLFLSISSAKIGEALCKRADFDQFPKDLKNLLKFHPHKQVRNDYFTSYAMKDKKDQEKVLNGQEDDLYYHLRREEHFGEPIDLDWEKLSRKAVLLKSKNLNPDLRDRIVNNLTDHRKSNYTFDELKTIYCNNR